MRFRMFGAPRLKLLVLREHGVDHLVQHVVGRLAEELRVGVQRLVRLAIEPCDVPDQLLASRARFDERHGTSVNGLTGTHHPLISRHSARQNGGRKRARFRGGVHAQKREPQDLHSGRAAVA